LLFKDIDDLIAFTNGATNGADILLAEALHTKVKEMLIATDSWISREGLFERIGLTNQSFNRKKFLDPLLDTGWIEMKYPDNVTHPEQRYKISESGKRLLEIINK
jgi:ATP-dependent DNA helicase RecG